MNPQGIHDPVRLRSENSAGRRAGQLEAKLSRRGHSATEPVFSVTRCILPKRLPGKIVLQYTAAIEIGLYVRVILSGHLLQFVLHM